MSTRKITMSLPEYADAIIPGIKDKAISRPAVIKQISITQAKAQGKKMRAVGLPKGVTFEKFGRFYTLTVRVPKNLEIAHAKNA